MLTIFLVSGFAFVAAVAAMSVGLIVRKRALRKRCVGCACETGERGDTCSTRQNAWY
ncbi:MAG: hypothetical protein JW819_04600 [Candidatus Krumholzibacteriota bacterium]|nr:hypothetical protein [Candidatus Krumholzibacteriota bacterium]